MSAIQQLLSSFGSTSTPSLNVSDVFSPTLYTGNNSTQTIINGINLAGEGGMVWTKSRDTGFIHELVDTVRGATSALISNSTLTYRSYGPYFYNTNGFSFGGGYVGNANNTRVTYASWTFRKSPKFFDIVTYVGNNGVARTISHSLGQVPGMIFIKSVTGLNAWAVYHRSLANTEFLTLNTTDAITTGSSYWNSTTATDSVFSLGSGLAVNNNGDTYIAYLFSHDPSGVIQCGNFTTNSSGNATVNLGWEPQYLMFKIKDVSGSWYIVDSTRGLSSSNTDRSLSPNDASIEQLYGGFSASTTGFTANLSPLHTYIYMAIKKP